jgi:hypothetical protein
VVGPELTLANGKEGDRKSREGLSRNDSNKQLGDVRKCGKRYLQNLSA